MELVTTLTCAKCGKSITVYPTSPTQPGVMVRCGTCYKKDKKTARDKALGIQKEEEE